MHPKAEQYIATAKQDFLMREGLTQKAYSPFDHYTDGYPESYYDKKTDKVYYYKTVPISVTDEEFEQLKEASKYGGTQKEENSNGVSVALKVIAWIIFIGGFIIGIVLGDESGSRNEFDFVAALSCWATTFVSGIIFLGFAEIIRLLHDIKHKL